MCSSDLQLRFDLTEGFPLVTTKKIQGKQKDIVIKWNRMGQDIPVADRDDELMSAEFNSPFEEFSLVMELKNTMVI